MEKVRRVIQYKDGVSYSFPLAFTQNIAMGITASDIPESAIYGFDSGGYDTKIVYDSTLSQEQNEAIAEVIDAVDAPVPPQSDRDSDLGVVIIKNNPTGGTQIGDNIK